MKILCNGCSFTYGAGFFDHERSILAYPGLLAKDLDADVINVAVPGSSNLEIFLRTILESTTELFDLVVVQWTELRRHWFEPCLGYEYRTASVVESDWTHGLYLSEKDRVKLNDQLIMLSGDYKALLDLACFSQILKDRFGQRLILINGLIPITDDLYTPGVNDMASHFSDFTKSVLEFDSKPDSDIKKYHDRLIRAFAPTLDRWVNISNSWRQNIVDHATQGHHPGPLSHRWLADIVLEKHG